MSKPLNLLTLDLQPFCGSRRLLGLYNASRPFRSGHHIFATDGCIAVKVDGDGPARVEHYVLSDEGRPPLYDLPWRRRYGRWARVPRKLPVHRRNGQRCVRWAGRLIRLKHHRLIRGLPGVEYRLGGEAGGMLAFRFTGGCGLVREVIVHKSESEVVHV